MAKRCGSKRCYVVNVGRSLSFEPHGDLPKGGDIPYEERWEQCALQFGHPGHHGASVGDKWLEWRDHYSG